MGKMYLVPFAFVMAILAFFPHDPLVPIIDLVAVITSPGNLRVSSIGMT